MRFDFDSPEAQSLRNSVAVAREALEKARAGYQDALATFVDMNRSDDGVFALRHQGRAYAHAVTQFSSAVIAWLTFVDRPLHPVQEIGASLDKDYL
jgi:hypothetical protein